MLWFRNARSSWIKESWKVNNSVKYGNLTFSYKKLINQFGQQHVFGGIRKFRGKHTQKLVHLFFKYRFPDFLIKKNSVMYKARVGPWIGQGSIFFKKCLKKSFSIDLRFVVCYGKTVIALLLFSLLFQDYIAAVWGQLRKYRRKSTLSLLLSQEKHLEKIVIKY